MTGDILETTADVVVVGGGIGGLAAAWSLRDREVIVLESQDRVGGRMLSRERGDYAVSVGAHMFPGPGSVVHQLVDELRLELMPIRGQLFGVAFGGKIILGGRPELLPFRLPLSAGDRMSMIRIGLKLMRDASQFNRLATIRPGETATDLRVRRLGFLGDMSTAEYLGTMHPGAAKIMRTVALRLTCEPEFSSAGCLVALFTHVWDSGDMTLGLNLRGGASALPEALARELDDRVRLGAHVVDVSPDGDGVRVRYESTDGERTIKARYAIVATTASRALEMIGDPPPAVAEALRAIKYGRYVVGGILTKERSAMPWDGMYSLITVDKAFNMLFNHANALRLPGSQRRPGGALMVYSGGDLASSLWERTEDEIAAAYADDLVRLYPEARGVVDDVWVHRWAEAAPYAFPGRYRLQSALEQAIHGRIFLVGDYVGDWVQMESAAETASEVAAKVRALLRIPGPEQLAPT